MKEIIQFSFSNSLTTILKECKYSITCKWLATFSLVSHGTFIKSSIFLGPASAKHKLCVINNFMDERYDDGYINTKIKLGSHTFIHLGIMLAMLRFKHNKWIY